MKDNVLHSGSGKVIVCLIEILFAKHTCPHIFNITSAWSGAFCSNWKKVRTNDRGYRNVLVCLCNCYGTQWKGRKTTLIKKLKASECLEIQLKISMLGRVTLFKDV